MTNILLAIIAGALIFHTLTTMQIADSESRDSLSAFLGILTSGFFSVLIGAVLMAIAWGFLALAATLGFTL